MEDLNSKEGVFKSIYYNLSSPGSFGSVQKLLNEARKIRSDITLKDVKEWLSGELVYTLHKPVIRKFKRNPVIAEGPYEDMQADLVDMQAISSNNNGFKYLLTAIDVFSKKAFAIAIKNKDQKCVTQGMASILEEYTPSQLMTDRGTEFSNQSFKALMKKYQINHYFTKNQDIKCSIVERFNRTLKNKMFKYFTMKGNRRYIDVLQDLLNSYNNCVHRSIKMAPNQVTETNKSEVFNNLYGFKSKRDYFLKLRKPQMATDVTVRKNYKKNIHDRGYYPNWTDNVYKIYKTMSGFNKPYYLLKSESGDLDKRKYYPEEVQKVKPNLFRIEKILKKRKIRGEKQFYVKWLNHPESDNSWIPAADLTAING